MRRLSHGAVGLAIVLIVLAAVVQLQRGALGEGALALPDPCSRVVAIDGDSLDARTQRVALRALDHASCELATSREDLLARVVVAVDEETDLPEEEGDALKGGLRAAIDEERAEGGINRLTAFTLSQAVRITPFDWLLRALGEIRPLLDL